MPNSSPRLSQIPLLLMLLWLHLFEESISVLIAFFFKDLFPKVLQFGLERRGGGRDKLGSKSSTISIVISEWHTHTAADGFS